MITDSLVLEKKEALISIAQECGVQSIKLFGSRLRGDARSDSDVDLLIRYDAKNLTLSPLSFDLRVRELFGNRVDIISEKNIYWYLRDSILQEAELLWQKID